MVDLPEPDLPTMATVSFFEIEKDILLRIWPPVLYAKSTPSNSISPEILSSRLPSLFSFS